MPGLPASRENVLRALKAAPGRGLRGSWDKGSRVLAHEAVAYERGISHPLPCTPTTLRVLHRSHPSRFEAAGRATPAEEVWE